MYSALQSGNSIALELSQCMVALFIKVVLSNTRISKPQLFYWKTGLVSKETAVFTPFIIIGITVARSFWNCTWLSHPACALATVGYCSAPVCHFSRITWHPPGMIALEHQWIKALIFDKLFTVCGDTGETGELQKICFRVVNVTWIRSCFFKSIHQRSVFAIVTDDSHANSILVRHVTGHVKGWHAFFAIWINDVNTIFRCRIKLL